MDGAYKCSEHGRFGRHSHHCPGCIEEARNILREVREREPLWGDLARKLDRVFELINCGVDRDGRPAFAGGKAGRV